MRGSEAHLELLDYGSDSTHLLLLEGEHRVIALHITRLFVVIWMV
jgi:hypothetical protein